MNVLIQVILSLMTIGLGFVGVIGIMSGDSPTIVVGALMLLGAAVCARGVWALG